VGDSVGYSVGYSVGNSDGNSDGTSVGASVLHPCCWLVKTMKQLWYDQTMTDILTHRHPSHFLLCV